MRFNIVFGLLQWLCNVPLLARERDGKLALVGHQKTLSNDSLVLPINSLFKSLRGSSWKIDADLSAPKNGAKWRCRGLNPLLLLEGEWGLSWPQSTTHIDWLAKDYVLISQFLSFIYLIIIYIYFLTFYAL